MARKSTPAYITEQDVFARRLTAIMQKRGLNQTQLAAKIKAEQETVIQRQTISQYMSGQSKPDTERLTILSKALNVSADYLVGLVGESNSTNDEKIRMISEYTGLSNNAVVAISKFPTKKSLIVNEIIISKHFDKFISEILLAIEHPSYTADLIAKYVFSSAGLHFPDTPEPDPEQSKAIAELLRPIVDSGIDFIDFFKFCAENAANSLFDDVCNGLAEKRGANNGKH